MWCTYAFNLLFVLDIKMGRGVEMKCSSGSVRNKTYSSLLRYRPPFLERDMVAPSWNVLEGEYRQHVQMRMRRGVGEGEGEVRGGDVVRMRSSSPPPPSSFPLKDDAGYIGYLTDDEQDIVVGGVASTVARRRRELLGSDADVSFSGCLFMMITVCGLLMLFLFAVSPWGVPPPKRL